MPLIASDIYIFICLVIIEALTKCQGFFILVLTSDLVRLHSNSNIAISVVALVVLKFCFSPNRKFFDCFLSVGCFLTSYNLINQCNSSF